MKIFIHLLLFSAFLLLCSCGGEKFSTIREVESENVKIKIKGGFAKHWEKGIAGGGHTLLAFPYAGFEKTWAISVMPEGFDTIQTELFEDFKGEMKEKQLADTLENISLQFSPDKQHLVYIRKSGNKEVKETIHFFGSKKGFVTMSSFFPDFDYAKPDWQKLKPTYEIAKDIIANDNYNAVFDGYSLWAAIEYETPENELDYISLKKFEDISSARYLIEKRNYDWNQRSEKWKAAVRTKFFEILDSSEKNNRRDPLIYYSVKSMIIRAADKEMDEKFISILAEKLDDRGNDEDLKAFFSDPNRKSRIVEMQKPVNKSLSALLKSNDIKDLETAFRIAQLISDSSVMKAATQKILSAWPDDTRAGTFFQNNFEKISSKEQQAVLQFAEKNIDTDNYIIARNLLEDYADCDKLTLLSKKHGNKVKLRKGCETKDK
ncbi:MAG: hypothetical protein IAF38_09710 [Bacteroidia bacterium]|nr:hypothetical protein [Bacteroidia bacterium]